MRQQLSSPVITFSLKIALLLIWLPFGVLIVMGIVDGTSRQGNLAVLALWVIGAMVMYSFGVRLKNVSMDAVHIHISNYIQKVKVPLRQVEEIKELGMFSWQTVRISFKRPTLLGEEIYFYPASDSFPSDTGSALAALMDAVQKTKQGF